MYLHSRLAEKLLAFDTLVLTDVVKTCQTQLVASKERIEHGNDNWATNKLWK